MIEIIIALLQILTFFQLTDTHISDSKTYPMVNEKLGYMVEVINEAQPTFVIMTGDMIHNEGDTFKQDIERLNSIINLDFWEQKSPIFYTVGNHELQNSGHLYKQEFGDFNYSFFLGGMKFIVFDNMRPDYAWLFKELDGPSIIFTHIPFGLVREESVMQKSFGFPSYRIFKDFDHPNIVAIVSGHLHLTGKKDKQIVTSGLGSYPCDYRIFKVYHDSITVETEQLPERFLNVSESLHGIPRWKVDYTDSNHTDHQSYIMGNEDERNFTIKRKAR